MKVKAKTNLDIGFGSAKKTNTSTLDAAAEDASFIPHEPCIANIYDCDLSCLDWTIVLSTGRAGSTTIQQMISQLPGMIFYGEEGGLLKEMLKLNTFVQRMGKHNNSLAWRGASDANEKALSCMTQKFYSERHGDKCLHRGCRHGFKEIRYDSTEDIEWIRTVFPSSKLVLNYRRSCQKNYTNKWGQTCSKMQNKTNTLVKAADNLPNVFHMALEQLANLDEWYNLASFLGFRECHALNVASANTNRSWTKLKHATKDNHWKCV